MKKGEKENKNEIIGKCGHDLPVTSGDLRIPKILEIK